jgi:RHS repeat-associated protein
MNCADKSALTWNTALGTPTLAVDHQYRNGTDEGYTDFIMGPTGLPLEQVDFSPAVPLWYYPDLQGNTRVLMNASGAVTTTCNPPPYGQVSNSFNLSGATPLQYAGTFTDESTHFVYDQHRWYDPSTGQFLSQDPLVDQTLQPYAYAGDNPVSRSDPTGLWTGSSPPAAVGPFKGSTTWHVNVCASLVYGGGPACNVAAMWDINAYFTVSWKPPVAGTGSPMPTTTDH